MGYGDELIATGLAKGAATRGVRIAFGDGHRILWSDKSAEIFRNNPNIASPGSDLRKVEWVRYYKNHRKYGEAKHGRWYFHDFQCPPGELFFDESERTFARTFAEHHGPFVVVEPNVKPFGACAGVNKQWPFEYYRELVARLHGRGISCVQFTRPRVPSIIEAAQRLHTQTFRQACAVLAQADLYIGPEGGLHHAAAAVGIPAVVIFGGFNTPKSTGYPTHDNIAIGEPCGRVAPCDHCRQIMAGIPVDRVLAGAFRLLQVRQVA